ncbi:MAG: glycosyltransferase, partial [Sphingobium sp.]
EKGVPFILDVLSSLAPDHAFTVRVVGDGAELAGLREQYSEASWCQFLGWKSQAEIADLFADSDVMLAPSLWSENAPGVVMQSLACGTPVLGSDGGGLSGVIEHQVTGMLLATGDHDVWRNAILGLIEDRAAREALIAGAEESKGRFDAREIFKVHLKVIDGTRHGLQGIRAQEANGV